MRDQRTFSVKGRAAMDDKLSKKQSAPLSYYTPAKIHLASHLTAQAASLDPDIAQLDQLSLQEDVALCGCRKASGRVCIVMYDCKKRA